jgi:hypothetical protein
MKTQTKWQKHLMEVYREMKENNKDTKLKDAMKKAKESYVK